TAQDAVLASTVGTRQAGDASAGGGAIARHLGAASYDEAPASPSQPVGPGVAGAAGGAGQAAAPWSVFERRTPFVDEGEAQGSPASAAAGEEDDDGASLEATELANRLRTALTPLGCRIEPLGRGQLNVHADMGRRGYRALVQLLSRTERLDWADLL